jgi:hypothetical protein
MVTVADSQVTDDAMTLYLGRPDDSLLQPKG